KTEICFLVVGILLSAVLFGPATVAVWWAYNSGWAGIPIVVATVVTITGFVVGWRFIFLLVTIALNRYAGPKETWHLSRGVTIRTGVIAALASLPINLIQSFATRASQELSATNMTVALALELSTPILLFLSSAASLAGIVLSYKFKLAQTAEPNGLAGELQT